MARISFRIPGLSAAAVLVGLAGAVTPGQAQQAPAPRPRPAAPAAPAGLLPPPAASASAPAVASTLPGGATSLQESYRDWSVVCVQQGAGKRCAASQVQAQQQSGQRVLAIEIDALRDNGAGGTLMLPFGLSLPSGVTLQIDDQPALAPLRFRTCLPSGCLVSLSFDASTLTALRAGTSLKVTVVADNGGETALTVSLAGFAPALDRLAVLTR
ncbi:MAG: invasion associated locus B family protein [Gemmobacter sp.]|jgi:invasion protein IalB|nr:invasion associated locus B family protein [Gemmobacter sp.]